MVQRNKEGRGPGYGNPYVALKLSHLEHERCDKNVSRILFVEIAISHC